MFLAALYIQNVLKMLIHSDSFIFDDFLKNNISFDILDKRYVVKLPFIEDHPYLKDNHNHCLKRLENLKSKLSANNKLLHEYNNIIKDQIISGVIEIAPEQNFNSEIHYLPHHPVVKYDKKTTKVRMVFDASCKASKISLNDCLHPGPQLTESLFGILIRFRTHKFCFISDIEKAFLQIKLAEEDRDFVRFLWFKSFKTLTEENINDQEIISFRLCRILFGVTSSPFILAAVLLHHAYTNLVADQNFLMQFSKSLHVDDFISGADTMSETLNIFIKCKNFLSEAIFNLRKFESNSKLKIWYILMS